MITLFPPPCTPAKAGVQMANSEEGVSDGAKSRRPPL